MVAPRIHIVVALLAACSGDAPVDDVDSPVQTDPLAHPNNTMEIPPWDEGVVRIFDFEQWDHDEVPVRHYMPVDPLGVVFVFHGLMADTGTVMGIEWTEVYNLLVQAGFGLVVTESDDIGWSTDLPADGNVDFLHIEEVRDVLLDATDLTELTPVFSLGFSNGGGFNPVFADMALQRGWDVRGYASHAPASSHEVDVPGLFVVTENDLKVDPAVANQAHVDLLDRYVETELHEIVEAPLDPRRFMRIDGLDEQDSLASFDDLVANGLIDTDGTRLLEVGPDDDPNAAFDAYLAQATGEAPGMVVAQLRVVWCLHEFNGAVAAAERDFFVAQLR